MLADLLGDNRRLTAALRDAKHVVDAAGDNATSSVIDDWTDEAEGRVWFLFETLRANRAPG